MYEEKEMTLEQMREKRSISEVLFKKFTEANQYFGTHAFCFYEGEDGKYYDSRVAQYWGTNVVTQVTGRKREVLKVMERIQGDPLYAGVCTMFFVDRDYDISLMNTNNDLFETPCYSVENLYAQEPVFSRVLQSEFGLNPMDPDYQKCLTDYKLRLKEFNQIIIKFNAVVKYQHQYAPEVICRFSDVKTSHLAQIEIDHVIKGKRHDEKINTLISKLSADAEQLVKLEEELNLERAPNLVFRGKNQLDFMVSFLMKLRDLNHAGGYFSEKLKRVYLDLTDNRLSELSQYAITPPELSSFLERHGPRASA